MDDFAYQSISAPNGPVSGLFAESIPIDAIADSVGTPCYVYSARTMLRHAERFRAAFAPVQPMLCYAVKACSNPLILRRLFAPRGSGGGGMGADVVSGLELERAWLAGCPMEQVVFAGVGKSDSEIRAALDGSCSPVREHALAIGRPDPSNRGPAGVLNTESRSELERIGVIARELGIRADVAIRVNPDIDAGTHDHTTTGRASDKFGVPAGEAAVLCEVFRDHPWVRIIGFHVHLGSPIYSPEPYVDAARMLHALIERVERSGTRITHLDLGGGFGADYETGQTPSYQSFADAIIPELAPLNARGVRIALEPGRTIMGNAGVLIVTVRHVKRQNGRRFVICDAGMNAIIRPSLYGAKHFVWPTTVRPADTPGERRCRTTADEPCDVVGPVCETGDFLARGVDLPEIRRGDRIAVFTAGAYGMTMASTYNDQPLPAEVLVEGDSVAVIREHQPAHETIQLGASARNISVLPGVYG
ncbi:MAG: diaminopimelate decarboxylase [Planctomycetota bacterium]